MWVSPYVGHTTRLDRKNFHWLSERLAFLGIMGAQLRAPLKSLGTIECCDGRVVSGCPQLVQNDTKRRQSLGELCVFTLLFWQFATRYSNVPMICSRKAPHLNIHVRRFSLEWTFGLHAEKYFPNLIKSNRNQIVFTIFWLIWNQTDVRLVPNQS